MSFVPTGGKSRNECGIHESVCPVKATILSIAISVCN